MATTRTTAELLAAWKKRTGFTNQQMADELGVSQPTVGEWLAGTTVPEDRRVAQIATALGLDEEVVASANSFARRKKVTNFAEFAATVTQLLAEQRRTAALLDQALAEVAELRSRLDALDGPGAPPSPPEKRKRR